MAFGVDPAEGFNLKRLSDIEDEVKNALSTIIDPATGDSLQPNFENNNDPGMQIVAVPLNIIADMWQLLQTLADYMNPNNATGAVLSNLVYLNGLKRKGSGSTAEIACAGVNGTVIPAGSLVSDGTNSWAVNDPISISFPGVGVGTVTCTVLGPIPGPAGTLTTIETAVDGWTAVSNSEDATLGESVETDEELRARRRNSTLAPAAGGYKDAIASALRNLEGVDYARVVDNPEDTTDANGIGPKRFAVFVNGGEDAAIANTILSRAAIMVTEDSLPNTSTVIILDSQGNSNAVSFVRPTQIDVVVDVVLLVTDSTIFPSSFVSDIQNYIVEYTKSGATSIDATDGYNEKGFDIGDDIIRSRLFTPINKVPGHTIISLQIAKLGDSLGDANIPINFNEIGVFTTDNITVTLQP